ncbi:MAG: CopG family ribbon-helix-helix protein [Acidimicrobiia bacterium]
MKVMISMPEELLAAVDAEAERRDQSRSALIRAALREHLVTRALDDREAALQSLRHAFAGGDWGDQTAEQLIRAERER